MIPPIDDFLRQRFTCLVIGITDHYSLHTLLQYYAGTSPYSSAFHEAARTTETFPYHFSDHV